MTLTATDHVTDATPTSAGRSATPARRRTLVTAAALVAAVAAVSVLSVLIGSRWISAGSLFDASASTHAVALAR
ncbi:MAG: hypothetical protein EOO74_02875, partial [Myxococcales bacterium]